MQYCCLDRSNGNDVARSVNSMTAFLAYALPSSPLSLLTIMRCPMLQSNAAAGAVGSDDSLIRDEDYHGPPSDTDL
ncbi:uncharacterized protein HD556DRAFT_1439274 [Suillus plorans]|uniref:Uncharacterized protein n=1 Tax=Suillus plorans TaxID=116603 RepID=A0A9P7DQD8_9AGAM|nr:uncharacterized protein HD556DRAFT_1439274 [Suillus plorans]KAG1800428.1 hypothetical protein HD556DRAFT_1439274 [Suillus plorans]